jgi:hypothetical protein
MCIHNQQQLTPTHLTWLDECADDHEDILQAGIDQMFDQELLPYYSSSPAAFAASPQILQGFSGRASDSGSSTEADKQTFHQPLAQAAVSRTAEDVFNAFDAFFSAELHQSNVQSEHQLQQQLHQGQQLLACEQQKQQELYMLLCQTLSAAKAEQLRPPGQQLLQAQTPVGTAAASTQCCSSTSTGTGNTAAENINIMRFSSISSMGNNSIAHLLSRTPKQHTPPATKPAHLTVQQQLPRLQHHSGLQRSSSSSSTSKHSEALLQGPLGDLLQRAGRPLQLQPGSSRQLPRQGSRFVSFARRKASNPLTLNPQLKVKAQKKVGDLHVLSVHAVLTSSDLDTESALCRVD